MKLRTKIMITALLPVFILGISIFILSADRTANGIYHEAYAGMQAASLAVRDIFEVGNQGSYHLDEHGDLWKGKTLNITQAVEIVDHIKDNTEMDVTIFWEDTRILTSIKNEAGGRLIHTKAPAAVTQKVLLNAEYYLDRNVEILGTEYIVCYAPFYQDGTDKPVGMVFVGKPHADVSKIINEIRLQMLTATAAVLLAASVTVILLVNRIVNAIGRSMGLLQQISDGHLAVQVDASLLNRPDEVGMLGKEILQLRNKFQKIADVLHEKSGQLDAASIALKGRCGAVLQLMEGLGTSAQEMSKSCASQAADASQAGSGVTQMGDMIGDSNEKIQKMYTISNQIKDMSEQTMAEIMELNEDMKKVRTSINYLEHQTSLTKESADKISRATDLIAAVASQTSLLSLNASIEAARAGDFGRGFGVVASEIQQLSIQANEAVDDIRIMVESLAKNSSQMTERMDQVQAVIENQEKNIWQTGQVFEQVRNGVLESVNHMDTVISKTQTMEQVRTGIVAAVQDSAAMSQENAANIEEMMSSVEDAYHEIRILSQNTEELGELSLQMKECVYVFSIQDT